jgi:3-oxoacyl-[acyl-carrier-protein] synthase-1
VDAESLLTDLAEAIGARLEVRVAFPRGRAAALEALHTAASDLESGRVTRTIVGGVDSLLRRNSIEQLGAEGALLTEKASSGHPVGEAAAFVVLERTGGPRPALAAVGQTAIANEPTARTEQPCEAVALSRVLRELRRSEPANAALPRLICDLNGDRYRATEWLLASTRALAGWEPASGGARRADLLHAADRIGDVGAASGAVALVWAVSALAKGYARADRVLVFGASDGPLRAGAIVRRT